MLSVLGKCAEISNMPIWAPHQLIHHSVHLTGMTVYVSLNPTSGDIDRLSAWDTLLRTRLHTSSLRGHFLHKVTEFLSIYRSQEPKLMLNICVKQFQRVSVQPYTVY